MAPRPYPLWAVVTGVMLIGSALGVGAAFLSAWAGWL